MAKKDLVVNIDSKTRGLEQGVSKSVNEVRKLEQQTRKSKNEFKQFDDRVGKLTSGNLSGLLSTMGNVAGVLGVAKLAQEGWMKTVRSSQKTSDDFDVAIGQATTSVDYFFTALSTGNFENFFQGITSAIAYSKELTEALDALADMKIADKFFKSEENYNFEKNRAIINAPDDEYTKEEKEAALAENKAIMDNMTKRADIIANKAEEARIAAFKKVTASVKIDRTKTEDELAAIFYDVMFNYDRDEGELPWDLEFARRANEFDSDSAADADMKTLFDKVYTGMDADYLKYEKWRKIEEQNKPKYTTSKGTTGGTTTKVENKETKALYEEAKKERELLEKNNADYAKLYQMKNVIGDEAMEEIARLNDDQWNALTTIERLRNTHNRLAKRVQNEDKGENKPKIPQKSLAEIDDKIKNINKEISLAINEDDRRVLYQQLQELEKEKRIITFQYKYEGNFNPNDRIENVSKGVSISPIKDVSDIAITLPTTNIEESVSSMQVWNDLMNKIREDNWGTIESFNGIAQSMSAIGGATKGTTAEMFQWAATTLSAIGQAIPVIMALTAVKEVEAEANAKVAVTGVASSLASIPIVGGILAVSAIASVVAAMSSIPKFAEGGLVYGNTLAQVGEYPGASNNPEVIAPLSKLRDILSDTQNNGVGGDVKFRIAGKELVGVINNYSSKQRKK